MEKMKYLSELEDLRKIKKLLTAHDVMKDSEAWFEFDFNDPIFCKIDWAKVYHQINNI